MCILNLLTGFNSPLHSLFHPLPKSEMEGKTFSTEFTLIFITLPHLSYWIIFPWLTQESLKELEKLCLSGIPWNSLDQGSREFIQLSEKFDHTCFFVNSLWWWMVLGDKYFTVDVLREKDQKKRTREGNVIDYRWTVQRLVIVFCVGLEINECKAVESRKSSRKNISEFEDQRDQMQLDMEIFLLITQSTDFIVQNCSICVTGFFLWILSLFYEEFNEQLSPSLF